MNENDDKFQLDRFITSQQKDYNRALAELKQGYKRSHWMWYIFPQLDGLAQSETSKYYAIKSIEEAVAYFNHPVLGTRLLECTNAIYQVQGKKILDILGYPDNLKLQSSVTLFAKISSDDLFFKVLKKYFQGQQDIKTLQLLEKPRLTQ